MSSMNGRYGARVWEHFVHPRGVGALDSAMDAVGTGTAGTALAGDVIRVQVQVEAQERIAAARFKAYGGCCTIATASYVAEWLQGRRLDEAEALLGGGIADALSLPLERRHCALIAEDALKAAIADYRAKQARRN